MWSRRYGCDVGTEMASAVGEDRGWGMSEAVPSQVFAHPYSIHALVYIGHGCVSNWALGVDGSYVNV